MIFGKKIKIEISSKYLIFRIFKITVVKIAVALEELTGFKITQFIDRYNL